MRAADEVLEVNREEIQALLERARQEPLDEGGYQKLQDLLRAFSYVVDMIGEKDTTISQLRALLQKPSTEKTEKVLERAGLKPSSNSSPHGPGGKAKPGHGRNGAEDYRGEREGLREERTGSAHPGGGSSAARSHGLRTGESAL